jgi:hypothetical protein
MQEPVRVVNFEIEISGDGEGGSRGAVEQRSACSGGHTNTRRNGETAALLEATCYVHDEGAGARRHEGRGLAVGQRVSPAGHVCAWARGSGVGGSRGVGEGGGVERERD